MSSFEGKLEAFLENFEHMKSVDNEEAFFKEFMSLKAQSAHYRDQNVYPAESGGLSVNRKKNRFKDIVPFEYTRVSLHPIEGVDGSDYVNANYIQGADGNVTYIAAQGPLPHTVNDFWRMLWYHNIEIVVMACKLVEMAKPKCECYWPNLNETKSYGPISISTISEENVANDFIIRDFVAECEGEKQQIRQYHYSSWPDHGRPNHPRPILNMIDRVHEYRQRLDVPLLVHCSAGCGRTGTIIAIDIARSMILTRNIPGAFTPHDIVESMRKQRPAMVQAKEQYIFVFMAMAELSTNALGDRSRSHVESESVSKNQNPARNSNEDSGDAYENITASGTPVPKPRSSASFKNSGSKITPTPEGSDGENGRASPVAPLRTNQAYENVSSNSVAKSKKPSPPLKPKPARPSGNEDTESPRSSTKVKPAPPPKPVDNTDGLEGEYSLVDMTKLRDKGPEIAVVSEEGKRAPLYKVEEELDRHGGDFVASRSILDTIMGAMNDLMDDDEDEKDPSPPPPPLPPPNAHKWSEFEDEVPPPVPLHTEASTHLLDSHKASSTCDSENLVCSTGIYYAPTPHSIPMPGGGLSSSNTHSPAPPPAVKSPPSPPSSARTMPATSSSSVKGGSVLKILKGLGKSKSEKRKPLTANDIGKPTGMPRSPSDHALSSPPRRLTPSPDHAMGRNATSDLGPAQSDPANNRYTFPGEMGFGIRIPRPKGPRPEPSHWNVIRNNITSI
jgi:tyrosine-protein phosphatase non-receptor type 12/18/22